MRVIGVIPARYGSTRLPAKVLAHIQGKPMIQHVWQRAKKSRILDDLVIACDDVRIMKAVERFGGKAVMTSKDHASGSDRIAEAVGSLPVDVVINIQGDEPLITHTAIDDLGQAMLDDAKCVMATLIKPLQVQKECENPNVVKVVIDQNKNALYFSRSVIPFHLKEISGKAVGYFKHLGIYAYRKQFLLIFTKLPKSSLEKIEQLEQLRVLEAGYKIKTVMTDAETMSVDTQEDLTKVEEFLNKGQRHG